MGRNALGQWRKIEEVRWTRNGHATFICCVSLVLKRREEQGVILQFAGELFKLFGCAREFPMLTIEPMRVTDTVVERCQRRRCMRFLARFLRRKDGTYRLQVRMRGSPLPMSLDEGSQCAIPTLRVVEAPIQLCRLC